MDVTSKSARTPQPETVPGEYIIGFKPGTTPEQRESAIHSLVPQTVEPLPSINGALVKLDIKTARNVKTVFNAVGNVAEFIQPNYIQHLRGDVNAPAVDDPQFAKQYHLENTGQTGGTKGADVKAPEAWKTSTGKGVVVALADTNIDINHPDLAANIWTNTKEVAGNNIDDDKNGYVDDVHGWNFGTNSNDPSKGGQSHGTHTAGIIGAVANNGVGVAGTAPNTTVMPLAILTSGSTTANAIKAFDYAAKNGANIISNSWGNNTYEPALQAAVTAASNAGLMVVVAAGNEHWDTGVHGSYPDNYAGSLSVAASDHNDKRASYSNKGNVTIDIAAPGDQVLSTMPRGGYAAMSGTSMAAPVVAGIAALVKSKYPNLTMKQVEDRINKSVQKDGSAASWNGLVATGGRTDAASALLPIGTPDAPAVADKARAGAAVPVTWKSDVVDGQRFEVQASTNADARASVNEDFNGGKASRNFRTDGEAGKWSVGQGGKDNTPGFVSPAMSSEKASLLELSETLDKSTELSFSYKAAKGAELSFFVDRNLQFQPTQNGEWQQFKTTVPAGEHTFQWLAGGRGGSGQVAIDDVKIGSVSEAQWKPVTTTEPGATKAEWTPDAATKAAQVRVRANNGKWAGDWATGPVFSVDAAAAAQK